MTGESTAVALFVKTPGYSPVKTRLAAGIGREAAEDFHRLSALAVASVVGEAESDLKIHPHWAVAEKDAVGDPLWLDFPAVFQGEGDLGRRLHRVYRILRKRHRAVIFLGADSPQITVEHIRQASAALEALNPATVIGLCKDGGFYLCGGNLPLALPVWLHVDYGTDSAARQWRENVSGKASLTVLETLFDVDHIEDLARLKDSLHRQYTSLTPAQKKLLSWLTGIVTGRGSNRDGRNPNGAEISG